jgi:hypothetical protein
VNGREDEIILCVLRGGGPALAAANEQEQTLRRLYTEVLGLLPQALEPVEPRPEVRERLLAAIREPAGAWSEEATLPGVMIGEPTASRSPEATLPGVMIGEPAARPAAATHPEAAGLEPLPVAAPARRRRWPTALAAAVALLAVGVASLLFVRLEESRAELARRERQLRTLEARSEEQTVQLASLQEELAEVSGRLGLITRAGTEACLLQPPDGLGIARGVVYIAADHRHWILKVSGLTPVPSDRAYQLWFVTEGGPVSGGTFQTSAGADAELGSPTMPSGLTAIAVTVEPAGGSPQPTGQQVLFGDETMRLL